MRILDDRYAFGFEDGVERGCVFGVPISDEEPHRSFHLAETSAVLTDRCATRTPKSNRHRPLAVPRLSVTEGLLGHADLAQDRADEAGDRAQVTSAFGEVSSP